MKKKFELELETENGAYWLFGKGYVMVFDPDKEEKVASDGMGASISKIEKEEEKMDKTNLSAPWHRLYHMFEALFEGDKDVQVERDEETYWIGLMVTDLDKADALTKLVPKKYEFENITVKVEVILTRLPIKNASLFRKAFKNNPNVSRIVTKHMPFSDRAMTYVVFQNKITQFYNDDIGDIDGNESTLLQEIAKEVFSDKHPTIFFCTEGEPK